MKKILLLIQITLGCLGINAQTGGISGKVTDAANGEALIGVTVFIDGTTLGTGTDIDGNFQLLKLQAGSYRVVARYLSYSTQTIESVVVKPGENSVLNIKLEANATQLKEFIVEASYNRASTAMQLMEQKNAGIVSDGISADLIRKTPDNAASDMLKRVSGASVHDNKYAVIRGLNDRYNAAYVNGAPLPSTESDRRAFSFDLFPAATIDNMVIYKTAAPNLPGDFAGGLIQISTRDIPEEKFISLSVSGSYHTQTTGKTMHHGARGKTDWLGFEDGSRALPEAIPDQVSFKSAALSDQRKLDYSKSFKNNWQLQRSTAPLNHSFHFSGGLPFRVFKKNGGVIFAASRAASYRFSSVERNSFDVMDNNQVLSRVQDSLSKQEVLSSLLLNFAVRPGKQSKISLKNSYTINGEDQTVVRTGATNLSDPNSAQAIRNTAFWYTGNKLFSSQLSAEQTLKIWDIKLSATAGYSNIQRDIPDFRRVSYSRLLNNPDEPYRAQIGSNVQLEQAGRFYSGLNEDMKSVAADISIPIAAIKNTDFAAQLSGGFFSQHRARQFRARQFGYVFRPGAGVPANIREMGLDTIFDPSRMTYQNGRYFMMEEATNPNDRYLAGNSVNAAYLMIDQKLFEKMRVIWGFRYEVFRQNLDALTANAEPVEVRLFKNDWLPSLNITYALNAKTNLRFSASKTLSRPELREIAPFAFYDFNIDYVVAGRPDLTVATIHNFDLRYEYFPEAGQVVSFSLFAKQFTNAIEYINDPDVGAGSRRFGYANVPRAVNRGVEAEFRKQLAILDAKWGTSFFSKITFVGNFALIHSAIDMSSFSLAGTGSRPLQGQSPYLINTGVQYTDEKSGMGASLMMNRSGRRIAFAGNAAIPDIYEQGRTIVDLQVSMKIRKKIDVKLGLSDLFAEDQLFYMDLDSNKKYDEIKDNKIFNYSFGRTVSLSVSMKL